mgnify:CR=1 FL=1
MRTTETTEKPSVKSRLEACGRVGRDAGARQGPAGQGKNRTQNQE